jgi:hypothetical protein
VSTANGDGDAWAVGEEAQTLGGEPDATTHQTRRCDICVSCAYLSCYDRPVCLPRAAQTVVARFGPL